MDVTVGERRSIVEHEGGLGGGAFLNGGVEAILLPVGDAQRLAFSQAGPHGEIGDGQVKGILELFGHIDGEMWVIDPVRQYPAGAGRVNGLTGVARAEISAQETLKLRGGRGEIDRRGRKGTNQSPWTTT